MTIVPEDIYQPEIQAKTEGSVLIITANNVEDIEFFYPYYRLIELGVRVDVATPSGSAFMGKHGLGLKSSRRLADVRAGDYQLLYIPGGKAPAELKKNKDALRIVKQCVENGIPIAAFCHGPQVLAAAGVIKGRNITGWPKIQDEIEEAGANYVNDETVVDGQFITGRWPADLPMYMSHVMENLYAARGRPIRAASM